MNECCFIDRGLPESSNRRMREAGFTFAEILASMMFVAIVIPVALHGIALANRAEIAADRKVEASRLAEKILNETILTDRWQTGDAQGDFGEDWPNYRWALTKETWELDDMQLLTVTVFYNVQDREYFVRTSTLVDDSATTDGTDES